MLISRRNILRTLTGLIMAPAVVRASNLMQIKGIPLMFPEQLVLDVPFILTEMIDPEVYRAIFDPRYGSDSGMFPVCLI